MPAESFCRLPFPPVLLLKPFSLKKSRVVSLETDMSTQIIMIVLVTIAVISILTAVLVVIFFVKGTEAGKQRGRLVN